MTGAWPIKLVAGAVVSVVVVGFAPEALADRREASLHAHFVGGMATTSDPAVSDNASSPIGGIAVRGSYATSNLFQYDVSLSILATGAAGFPTGMFTPPGRPTVSGPFTVSTQVTRLDGGATLRFGVAWIPTLRLAAGVQGRHRGAPVVTSGGVEVSGEDDTGRGSELVLDLVGSATVGLDHRLTKRWIVGAAIGASLAVPLGGEPFRTIEGTAHAAYYWYPRF